MHEFHFVAWFFGGVFLANAVPHFVSGVRGEPFQSPFAKPRGRGLSSSTVNVVWGLFNLVAGYALVCHVGQFELRNTADAATLGLGMLAIGLFAARHFGQFHGGRDTR
ncbi:hypothetical protein AB4851_14205 [Burkholderia sp. 22PA0099]|uniref:hypothetical protein n=1 Tax=Burkholderia sp. 22PA0099 TaxID=3237372 RepID=UPI0039C0771F